MKCFNQFCKNECNEGYKYCSECYEKWKLNNVKKDSTFEAAAKWDENPLIDVLLKINANLGNIALALKKLDYIEERLNEIHFTMSNKKAKK